MRFSLGMLIRLAALAAWPVVACAGSAVKSQDGLSITFGNEGRVESILVDEQSLPIASTGGFQIKDVRSQTGFLPVTVSVAVSNGITHLLGKLEEQRLELRANVSSKGEYLAVDGFLRDLIGKDRAIDLKFSLPVDARGWNWGGGIEDERSIEKAAHGHRAADGVTVYPLAPISNAKLNVGLSMAVPPDAPSVFETGADKNGLSITFKLGISSATQPSSQTPFHFVIYRHDPAWGFRSSLERYYYLFREPFFVRKVNKIGAWGWHHPPPSEWTNANLYAFHECGGETWQTKDEGMHGYEHEGTNLANSVADFERLSKLSDDQKLGIYSLPYTMVGQRQIYRLATMPKDRDEAMAAFEKWTTKDPIIFQTPGPSVSFRTVDQLKEMIRNSNVYDERQKPSVLLRDYLGNTVTFPLNPNPRLFSDSNAVTIARYTLEDYLPMLFSGSKYVDGCYVDSLGRWPGYYNFRREHFRYTALPLTYSGKDASPCIWNLQSHAEYLQELSKRLHQQNKIVFANGVHANRVMLGFYVDALGMEGLPDFARGDGYFSTRVAAGTKPYCALNGRDNVSARAWNSCLYLGILIGARSEKGAAMERKYLPAIIHINEAGWQPITLAKSDSDQVMVERWGGGQGKPVAFTLLNRSKHPAKTTIHVDAAALGIRAGVLHDLVAQKALPAVWKNGEATFACELPAETAQGVEFTGN